MSFDVNDNSAVAEGRTPWIGVDFDGTLATYAGWKVQGKALGEPIRPMLSLVKEWLDMGREVKIFTARASSSAPDRLADIAAIQDWCEKHVGKRLEVTAEKDFAMEALFDDLAFRVERNTGRLVIKP